MNLAANTSKDTVITTVDLPPDWEGKLQLEVPELCVNVTQRSKIGAQFKGTKYEKKIRQIYCD